MNVWKMNVWNLESSGFHLHLTLTLSIYQNQLPFSGGKRWDILADKAKMLASKKITEFPNIEGETISLKEQVILIAYLKPNSWLEFLPYFIFLHAVTMIPAFLVRQMTHSFFLVSFLIAVTNYQA